MRWFVLMFLWCAIGCGWGLLILYRRQQAEGVACIFLPAAAALGPVLILIDLISWLLYRLERWLDNDAT